MFGALLFPWIENGNCRLEWECWWNIYFFFSYTDEQWRFSRQTENATNPHQRYTRTRGKRILCGLNSRMLPYGWKHRQLLQAKKQMWRSTNNHWVLNWARKNELWWFSRRHNDVLGPSMSYFDGKMITKWNSNKNFNHQHIYIYWCNGAVPFPVHWFKVVKNVNKNSYQCHSIGWILAVKMNW